MAFPLEQCVVALSGKFDQTHAEIAKLLKENGGKHATKVVDDVTHLVATEADVDKEAPKVKQASQYPDIKLVSYEWLRSSVTSKQKLDESPSEMTATGNSSTKLAKGKRKLKEQKRVRSETPVDEVTSAYKKAVQQPRAKKFKETQKANSRSLVIPVDEHCPLVGSYRVYIDNDGIIYDATLNQTSAGDNHNKFYRVQLLCSSAGGFQTWTRWGRVSATGSGALLGTGDLHDAMKFFELKFREKSGNAWEDRLKPARTDRKKPFYTFIERQYENESSEEEAADPTIEPTSKQDRKASPAERLESRLPKPVQRLMELIFNKQFFADTMRILDYDAEKLPLGQLSKRTLQHGFLALKELGGLLANPIIGDFVWSQRLEQCSNMYFTLIPHNFGRHTPPVIHSDEALRKEIALLESLSDMEIANKIMKDEAGKAGDTVHALDKQFAALNLLEMTPPT